MYHTVIKFVAKFLRAWSATKLSVTSGGKTVSRNFAETLDFVAKFLILFD